MVGNDADTNGSPSQNNEINSYVKYLELASKAQSEGDARLALHLYLAAYESSLQDSRTPDKVVIEGLKKAWTLACKSKERSLAEHVFEKLEPYLTGEEIAQYAAKLQRLALERLEEFGLSRKDLEDMTDVISQDFFGMDPSSMFMCVEQSMSGKNPFSEVQRGLIRDRASETEVSEDETHSEDVQEQHQQSFSEKQEEKIDEASASSSEIVQDTIENQKEGTQIEGVAENIFNSMRPMDPAQNIFAQPGFITSKSDKEDADSERLTYKDLVGYDRAIEIMHSHGIGIQDEPSFKELINMLNEKHGLSRMPITDVYLFHSPVREDANQFMLATMGEIDQPVIRMRMEENLQGIPVLCVMASSDQQARLNTIRTAIDGGGVLILEDVDLWAVPLMESSAEDGNGFFQAQLSRGAREAMNLIKSAIENPDVYVLMSASKESGIDTLIYDVLPPITIINIEVPDKEERTQLWTNILSEHPSLKGIDVDALVSYSARMSRFDIYMAAREAVEEAYKASLAAKKYIPVDSAELFEKIAAYQPLESGEYLQLENAVVESFADKLDDFFEGIE